MGNKCESNCGALLASPLPGLLDLIPWSLTFDVNSGIYVWTQIVLKGYTETYQRITFRSMSKDKKKYLKFEDEKGKVELSEIYKLENPFNYVTMLTQGYTMLVDKSTYFYPALLCIGGNPPVLQIMDAFYSFVTNFIYFSGKKRFNKMLKSFQNYIYNTCRRNFNDIDLVLNNQYIKNISMNCPSEIWSQCIKISYYIQYQNGNIITDVPTNSSFVFSAYKDKTTHFEINDSFDIFNMLPNIDNSKIIITSTSDNIPHINVILPKCDNSS